VAVFLTLVQKKQIRINIHKRNNKKIVQIIQNTASTSIHITKAPTRYQNTHTITKTPKLTEM
jgi:ribosomal protein L18